MDEPLDEGNWPVIAPSPCPGRRSTRSRAPMTRADMDEVLDEFVARDRDGARPASTWSSCTAPTAICCRLHHAAHEPAHRRIWRQAREPPALPARSVRGDARGVARRTSRCRCASPRPTGPTGGITPDDAVEIARGLRARRRRPDRRLGRPDLGARRSRSTAACSRRRSPTGSATRPGSRPWRSATSTSPTTSTRSSPPAAPTSAALARPHLVDPFWTLRAAAQLGYDQVAWPVQYLSGREQFVRNLKRAADLAIAGMSPGAAGALAGRHAVVTGGGRGIGAAIATALAAGGAQVTLLGRNAAQLKEKCRDAAGRAGDLLRRDRRSRGRARHSPKPATRLWPGGDPGQQRWRRRIGAVRAHLARAVAAHAGRQPDRHVPVQPRRAARHARSGLRPDRQCREHRRPERCCLCRGVLRRQARGRRPDPRARAGDGDQRRHRERRLPGLHRHRHGAARGRQHRRQDRAKRGRCARRSWSGRTRKAG